MKIKFAIVTLLSMVVSGSVLAQDVEQDDMYFNKKDRAKQREAQSVNVAYAASKKFKNAEERENPTDSYSARNVNPEYTSRAQSETAQADESDYYVANYRYANQGYYNNFNSRYNNWMNDPWYQSNYYGSSIYGWNSPYYGSQYDAWGNPWGNPYYRYGWSSGFSFYYGRSWGYNNFYGYNNCYSCSYYGYNDPFWNPYYAGAYSPFGYYGGNMFGYRPTRVVYVSHDDYRGNYGKRSSRSSQIGRDYDGVRGNRLAEGVRDGSRTNSGGRVNSNRQQEYYNNTWRNNSNSSYSTPSRSASPSWDNSSNSNNGRSSWESQQRSNSSFSTPSRTYDAGRSSSGSSGGGGGHSSGSGSRSSRGN